MSHPVITAHNLTKEFFLPHERRDTLKEHLFRILRPVTYEKLKAVDNVSLEIKEGEFVGIVGRNGSGKSTLLKLIAGIFVPTFGSVKVKGTISPFLELGVGFQPELSGKDNVFLYGALLGLTRREVQRKYQPIVDFAELERFMDQRVKNYSFGMQVRLAFSITIHAAADILLVDEVLAVGDQYFQEKCLAWMNRLKSAGKTVVFVSHDLTLVKNTCGRVVWLDGGKIIMIGPSQDVVNSYLNIKRHK